MKHLKNFNDKNYNFSINNDKFLIEFIFKGHRIWKMQYFIWDDDIKNWSVTKLSNTNPFKIIDIVLGKYLNLFISEFNPTKIEIEGLSKDQEKSYISQRTKMYVRYLVKNVPNGYSISPKDIDSIYNNNISINKI